MNDQCKKCGQVHDRCHGHRDDGQPCGRHPRTGAQVCPVHGGGAPQVIAAADRRTAETEARRAVQTFGLPRSVDPAVALLEEVARSAGAVDWLGEKVRSLDPEALVWGAKSHTSGRMAQGPVDYTEEGAVLSLWLELWREERRHLVLVCSAALKAGVEERQVRVAEAQGALIAGIIREVLDAPELGLDAVRRRAADRLVHKHLTALAGGAA